MPVTVTTRDMTGQEVRVPIDKAEGWTFGPNGQLTLVDAAPADVAVFAAGAWLYAEKGDS
jgi:hypothetical protein